MAGATSPAFTRRRELAGEEVRLDEDFLDRYDRYN